jgi:hypothetical protein
MRNGTNSEGLIPGWTDRRTDALFLLCCFIVLYLHLFVLPGTPIFYEMDHVALMNDAKRMLEGEVIYRDFFDFPFPGSHTLYFLFFKIFGPKYWVSGVLIVAHGLAAAALGLAIGRRLGLGGAAYLAPAIYISFGFRWFGIDGEHRMFSPLFAYAAVLVLMKGSTYPRAALAGLMCAFCSFFTQQRGILVVAAIGLCFFVEVGVRRREWLRSLISSATILGSFVGVLCLLLPFIIAAGWEVFYESTILFLFSYVGDPASNSLQTYFTTLTKVTTLGKTVTVVAGFYYLLVPAVYFIALAVLWFKRKSGLAQQTGPVLLIAFTGLLLAAGTPGPNAVRIFQVSLPALILFAWLLTEIVELRLRWVRFALALLFAAAFLLGIRVQTAWDINTLETPSGNLAFTSPEMHYRYSYIAELSRPGDLLFQTWNAHMNFPLGLPNPSRISILLNTGYTPSKQLDEAIEDLRVSKARFIIWDGSWSRELYYAREGERLKPFERFLKKHYQLREKFAPFDGHEIELWERIDP